MTPKDALRDLSKMRIEVPTIKMPELKTDSRSLAELKRISDEEIRAFIDGDLSDGAFIPVIPIQMALHELAMRQIERATKPHWSVLWTFWLVLASFVTALVGVLLMLR